MERLIKMIKMGKVVSKETVASLLGQEQIWKTNFINYDLLQEYARFIEITDKELNDLIIKYGSSKLLLDALQTTKDCETFAKPWYNKSKIETVIKDYILYSLGYKIENEIKPEEKENITYNLFTYDRYEDLQKDEKVINLLQSKYEDLKRSLLGNSKQQNVLEQVFSQNNLSLLDYEDKFNVINDKEVYFDIIMGNNSFFNPKHFSQYIKKFGVEKHSIELVDFYITEIGKTQEVLSNKQLEDFMLIYDSIVTSNSHVLYKTNLWIMIGIFKNKEITNKYQEDSLKMAKAYLKYLGKIDINTGNKYYHSLPKIEPFKRWYANRKIFEKEIFNCLLDGMVQEYFKYIFVNNPVMQKQWCAYYFKRDAKINWDNYYQTDSYKKLPVPKEVLFSEIENRLKLWKWPDYPFFIIARNALKMPGFDKSLLSNPDFYQKGFHNKIFKRTKSNDEQKLPELILKDDLVDTDTQVIYEMTEEEFNQLLDYYNGDLPCEEIDGNYNYEEEIKEFDEYQKLIEDSLNIKITR